MSITGLKTGTFTSIDNSGEIRLGREIDSGTAGEVIVSGGANQPVEWGPNGVAVPNALTAGTNVNYTSGNPTWDGSVADTINSVDTDTTYSAGSGIDLTGTTFSTDNDGTTIDNSGGTGAQNQVLKVPNALTAGTNITYSAGTTFDGSAAITINSTDTDTTYSAGNGIDLTGTTFSTDNDGTTINNTGGTGAQNQVLKVPADLTINGIVYNGSLATNFTLPTAPIPNADLQNSSITLGTTSVSLGGTAVILDFLELDDCQGITMDADIDCDCNDIDNVKDLTYCAGGSALTGGGGAGDETTGTYLDLSSDTNIFPSFLPASVVPYLDLAYYDPGSTTSQSLTTSFVQIFSGAMTLTFVCQPGRTMAEVELKVMNYGGSSNRWIYLGLLDSAGTTEWTTSMASGGGYGTGTQPTERQVHYKDETDGDYVVMSWILTGLTPGNTYIVNPSVKTNSTSNYIYAGGNIYTRYPACISKVVQL